MDEIQPEQIVANPFYEVAFLLILASVAGTVGLRLRQPLIVAFLAVGIVVGPGVLGWVSPDEQLELLADMGIAVLLFVVGLKLDLGLIRRMGPVALATGLGQVGFTSGVGFGLAWLLGFGVTASVYIAVALTFSSTIIIVKLLSDKREIDDLHGRIAVGFLIVQDICVVLVMIVLSAVGAGGEEGAWWLDIVWVLVRGLLFLGVIGAMMRWVLPWLLDQVAASAELMMIFSIGWALALAAVSEMLGLSTEVGAFLGGVSIASTDFREAIASRLVTLRDFLLLFFFIVLGAELDLDTLGAQIGPGLLLSLFVLIGNPLIVMAIMGWMGYRRRTGFLAGLAVAQISEFSLILTSLGMDLGHVGEDVLGLVTLVGLITIALSTYMITYSGPLFRWLEPWLGVFERERPHREIAYEQTPDAAGPDVVVFGFGRLGGRIAHVLHERGLRVLGVDFDPDKAPTRNEAAVPVVFGDAADAEFIEHLDLTDAAWVVSTLPQRDANVALMQALRRRGFEGRVGVTAFSDRDAGLLRREGPDLVLRPLVEAAEHAVEAVLASGGDADGPAAREGDGG